jgi:hypothetical protein
MNKDYWNVLMHESAHAATALYLKLKVERIRIMKTTEKEWNDKGLFYRGYIWITCSKKKAYRKAIAYLGPWALEQQDNFDGRIGSSGDVEGAKLIIEEDCPDEIFETVETDALDTTPYLLEEIHSLADFLNENKEKDDYYPVIDVENRELQKFWKSKGYERV